MFSQITAGSSAGQETPFQESRAIKYTITPKSHHVRILITDVNVSAQFSLPLNLFMSSQMTPQHDLFYNVVLFCLCCHTKIALSFSELIWFLCLSINDLSLEIGFKCKYRSFIDQLLLISTRISLLC